VNKAKKFKMTLLVLAVVVELVAVFVIAKAYATESSPTIGLTGLVIGLVLLVIAMTRKSESGKADEN
jgi:multisubunit Na+/H+ antiporter MnhB subunit